uniref:Uncharacterized protein n=1 Tax=Romanomermis culicivorax TaxID=13658 RepID=A0A915K0K5_ROMCU
MNLSYNSKICKSSSILGMYNSNPIICTIYLLSDSPNRCVTGGKRASVAGSRLTSIFISDKSSSS